MKAAAIVPRSHDLKLIGADRAIGDEQAVHHLEPIDRVGHSLLDRRHLKLCAALEVGMLAVLFQQIDPPEQDAGNDQPERGNA